MYSWDCLLKTWKFNLFSSYTTKTVLCAPFTFFAKVPLLKEVDNPNVIGSIRKFTGEPISFATEISLNEWIFLIFLNVSWFISVLSNLKLSLFIINGSNRVENKLVCFIPHDWLVFLGCYNEICLPVCRRTKSRLWFVYTTQIRLCWSCTLTAQDIICTAVICRLRCPL